MISLTEEQFLATKQQPGGVACQSPDGTKRFLVVDVDFSEQAINKLQWEANRLALRTAIAQMEAGGGKPLAQVRGELEREFGLPNRAA